jgi:hypothetical protein
LGVLLRSILVEREPIYRQQELVASFCPKAFGLDEQLASDLSDDHVGRALDRLFDADRGTLLTQVVVAAAQRFGVRFEELHNDSTSVRLCGQYRQAQGRSMRGKRAPWITYGYSKGHRPDLEQLLFVLTTSSDGGVPVQFRCADGNTNDSTTHLETWKTLCLAAGRADFLYVADSKLCASEVMQEIDRAGGRFVTVMPRNRKEDGDFRKWIQANTPEWGAGDRPPAPAQATRTTRSVACLPTQASFTRGLAGDLGVEHAARARSTAPAARAHRQGLRGARRRRSPAVRAATQAAIEGPRPRARLRDRRGSKRLALPDRRAVAGGDRALSQEHPGRPGPDTRYTRNVKQRWWLRRTIDEDIIEFDRKSDGMYALVTNDRTL